VFSSGVTVFPDIDLKQPRAGSSCLACHLALVGNLEALFLLINRDRDIHGSMIGVFPGFYWHRC